MKFKTFVITRKKLIFTLLCIGVTAAVGALASVVRTSESAVAAFKSDEGIYTDILSEGLPSENGGEFSIKSVFGKFTGLDFENPENIISHYSASFERGQQPESQSQMETDSDKKTPVPAFEPVLASKEQINSSTGLALNNATSYEPDIDAMCSENLGFSIDDKGPQVLVIHTHTTECYDGDAMSGESERTTDDSHNVIEVGNVICDTLEENGIPTLHDTTYHDYPSYQGSYTRALSSISKQLAQNPSIKMVLDIHRDAFIYSDGSKLTVKCDQNGVPTAKVMLVCGSDSMGLEHANWRENLKLAAKIQNAAEIMYPDLMRPVNLRTERFNMHMTTGSLLIEVGSNGNTLDEAKAGGRDVARAIAAVLKNQ